FTSTQLPISTRNCLNTLTDCLMNQPDSHELMLPNGRTEENVFHYCEDTRNYVIPCMAKHLNVTLGPTAYDKGAFLHSCPYFKNGFDKQIMQDYGRAYLLTCVYNDIRNMQHKECLQYIVSDCGVRGNKTMSECSGLNPCPNHGKGLYDIYSKRTIHVIRSSSEEDTQFKTGKHGKQGDSSSFTRSITLT
ncbi:hypothetical protein PMAYCL1PPCAC_17730, partial [Pristionchus mayeri]